MNNKQKENKANIIPHSQETFKFVLAKDSSPPKSIVSLTGI